MRIGIKYCGGCNSGYNRKAAVEKLKKRLPGCSIEPVNEKEAYDKILLVCGCTRTCIRDYRIAGTTEYAVLQSKAGFDEIDE